MNIATEQFHGCLLGIALGDSYGAAYEGGKLERLLWRLIGKTAKGKRRYTDDTQMSLDIATHFLACQRIKQDELARQFAASYRWSRGYGPAAAWLLKRVARGKDWRQLNRKKFSQGSYGNGAAMRAAVLALCYPGSITTMLQAVHDSAEITHAHPLAIEGAMHIALAAYAALHHQSPQQLLALLYQHSQCSEYQSRLTCCATLLEHRHYRADDIAEQLGHGMAATESTVTAIYFALRFLKQDFSAMLQAICELGGDTDTICAMAGAIWGAYHGSQAFSEPQLRSVENLTLLNHTAQQLYQRYSSTI